MSDANKLDSNTISEEPPPKSPLSDNKRINDINGDGRLLSAVLVGLPNRARLGVWSMVIRGPNGKLLLIK
jgi:hypothetical protein